MAKNLGLPKLNAFEKENLDKVSLSPPSTVSFPNTPGVNPSCLLLVLQLLPELKKNIKKGEEFAKSN